MNTIFNDVCVPGYARKVQAVPAWLKKQAYAEYGITGYKPSDYEVDHLIPLSLGGSNSIRNLWPQSEGIPNQEKSDSDFEEWLNAKYPTEQERAEYVGKHYIPNVPLAIQHFLEFIAERRKLMKARFAALFDLSGVSQFYF